MLKLLFRKITDITIVSFFLIAIGIGYNITNCFSQNISTVVGFTTAPGANGYDINGGSATAAQLNNPSAVTVDGTGNVYIMDYGNNRIRKVNTSGNIYTVAGVCNSGSGSYSGDGGQATDAELKISTTRVPVCMGVNTAGDYYIPDQDNHVIRKVTVSTGIINTVAGYDAGGFGIAGFFGDGGQATDARFDNPTGVAVDAAGNIYIADRDNHRIRKVTASTGIVTTIAGNGTGAFGGDGGQATAANLFRPSGIAVDASGNLFIADFSNNRIRKVNTSGVISTVAGYTTTVGFSGDGGQATDANLNLNGGSTTNSAAVAVDASGNFYIADASNQRIRKVTVSTGVITTVAGYTTTASFSGDGGQATAAGLSAPRGVWVDASGNIYIADRGNYRIRKVDVASGIISTVAGTGVQGSFSNSGIANISQLNLPKDVALDPGGNIYVVTNTGYGVVWKISPAGVIAAVAGTGVAGNTGDGGPATLAQVDVSGIAVDANCNLYLADDNDYIRKVTAATGIISSIAGTGVSGFSGDGGQATAAQIATNGAGVAIGIAVDASGNIYFTDQDNGRIRKITVSTGIISTVAGSNATDAFGGDGGAATAAAVRFYDPEGIDLDASGNLYIADLGNHRVRKVTASTGIITTVAGDGVFADAGDGGQATAASIKAPSGIAIDQTTGDIYISDGTSARVRKVTVSTGIITTVAGNGAFGFSGDGGAATAAQLSGPAGIAVSNGSGCLYVADWSNYRIRFVDIGGGGVGSCASIPGSCPMVLPVQLLSFNVYCAGSVVRCNWATASETNNDYFTVERSADGKTWSEIGTIKGAGYSSAIHNYEFIDDRLPSPAGEGLGMRYYRLKQTDYNGQYEYFGPVAANCSGHNNFELIIQNIVGGSTLSGILVVEEDADLLLNIIDVQGRIIKHEKIRAHKGSNFLQTELDGIDAGMYFIAIYNAAVKLHKKFIRHSSPH